MRLLIMGPQGVGKGTQAALLSEHYGIPAISTGDIFRYNIKNKTELGVEALKYIDKGELVPDELTNKIVKDRLAMDDAKNGWILDGYPRNASQVEALDAILGELDTPLDAVVALDADHDVLMERMKKRAEIEGRSDDTPEAIAKRLDVYGQGDRAAAGHLPEARPAQDVQWRRRRRRDPGHHRGGAWLKEKPSRITYFQRKRESRHAERVLIPAFVYSCKLVCLRARIVIAKERNEAHG